MRGRSCIKSDPMLERVVKDQRLALTPLPRLAGDREFAAAVRRECQYQEHPQLGVHRPGVWVRDRGSYLQIQLDGAGSIMRERAHGGKVGYECAQRWQHVRAYVVFRGELAGAIDIELTPRAYLQLRPRASPSHGDASAARDALLH